MGKITGFLEYEREDRHYEPVEERIKHWREFIHPLPEAENKKQAASADRAFERGWVKPEPPSLKTGKRVAIVGSGPAGMACAQQLARVGHDVHVFEKLAKAGGLLTYGIPDFKMEKHVIARRAAQMEAEGVIFHYNAHVGVNMPAEALLRDYDALVLAGGAEEARDLPIPGRELKGIHFAMDFLPQQNRRVSGEPQEGEPILAADKHVVVIGGGDTGSDCIGTAFRQGARSAMGFVHPVHKGMIEDLELKLDQRGNVKADTLAYQSSNPKIFAAGDMRRGQSLVVWAIREGRQAAHSVDKFLMGSTTLPR